MNFKGFIFPAEPGALKKVLLWVEEWIWNEMSYLEDCAALIVSEIERAILSNR